MAESPPLALNCRLAQYLRTKRPLAFPSGDVSLKMKGGGGKIAPNLPKEIV